MARSKQRQTTFLTAFILLVVFAPIAFFVSKNASLSRAAWYDVNWGYRKPVAITYSGATLTNEDILIQLDTAALITANKLQSDCDDIRLVDSDETTAISYWIEAGCNTTTTQIWARVPSIPNGGKTIYLYYGNASATNAEQSWAGTFTLLNAAACPTGWTRNTNFDNKFPYGSTTAGTTGGSSSHNHAHVSTTSTTSSYSENITAEGGSGSSYINEHDHTIGTNINTNSSVLPPYIDTVYCYKSKLDINSNLIALFTSTPSGWTRSSAFDTRFPRGASGYGATGGATTHTHTFPGETSSAADSLAFNSIPSGSFAAAGGHTHTVNSGTTNAGNNTPPYLNLIFATNNADGYGTNGIITLTSVLPPLGWNRYVALDSNFPRGNTTAGGTGGTTTHTHVVNLITGIASASVEDYDWGAGADPGHGHTGSTTTDAQSNLPPYYSIIFAQRKTPTATTGTPGSETPQPTTTQIVNSLSIYLKLDENTGTLAHDSSGSNNNGTLSSASWLSADQCISNSCVSLNGTNSVVTVANALSTIKTISFWVNPSTTSEQLLDLNGVAYVNLVSGTISLTGFTSPTIYVNGTVKSTLTAGTWQHVAIATDTAINGSAIKIGQISTNYGQINVDEFRLYNYARSAAQVLTDYNAVGSSNATSVFGDAMSSQLPSGLLGYWKLDETSGSTALDSSGNGYNGTVYGTGSFAQGYLDNGFAQAGATPNRIDLGDQAAFEIQQFTISAWVKLNGSCNYGMCAIFSKGCSTNIGYGMGIRNATGYRLEMNIRDIQNVTSNATVNIGEWHHLAATVDGSKITLYIDGNLDKQVTQTSTPTFATETVKIANQNSGNDLYLNGALDEVRFYNRALTGTEIKTISNYFPSRLRQSLAWYKFDENQGATAYNSAVTNPTGSITSGAWNPVGKNNGALTFTASTSVTATITDPGYVNTISLWLYPTSSIASKTLVTAGKLATDSSSRPTYGNCTGTAIPLNQWTHLAVVSNGTGTCKIYQNGLPTASSTTGVTFGTSVNIGATSYIGMIDDFRMYNFALTANEIKQDFNTGSTSKSGQSTQTISGTTTSLEYCIPGDTSSCAAPVAEYNFEEGQGSVLKDTSGNNVQATIYNSAGFTNGKIGNAFNFNGTNTYAGVTDSGTSPYDITGNLTISLWAKWRLFKNYGCLVQKGSGGGGLSFNYGVWSYSNQVTIEFSNGVSMQVVSIPSSLISLNTWHHIAFVIDGTNVTPYLDGLKQTPVAQTVIPTANDNLFSIGQVTYSPDGAIDQVRIYNYARTSAQIAYDYNKGLPIGWWKFDECSGTTANDATGRNNLGTITIGASGTQTAIGTCSTTSTAWGDGVTGKLNSSLNFDGTDDMVEIPNGSTLGTTTNMSISAWIKPTSVSKGSIYGEFTENGDYTRNYLNILSGKVNFDQYNPSGGSLTSNFTVPTNSWTHIVYTQNGSDRKIYINGNLDIQDSSAEIYASASPTKTRIGYRGSNQSNYAFSGQIDDVRIYNYAVTPDQVKQIFTNGGMTFGPSTGIPQ